MKLGLHYWNYSQPADTSRIAPTLAETARIVEDAGFHRFTVMDHYFQMEHRGTADEPMLEGYTTLGYVAARTELRKVRSTADPIVSSTRSSAMAPICATNPVSSVPTTSTV